MVGDSHFRYWKYLNRVGHLDRKDGWLFLSDICFFISDGKTDTFQELRAGAIPTWTFDIHEITVWALHQSLQFTFSPFFLNRGMKQVFSELLIEIEKMSSQFVHMNINFLWVVSVTADWTRALDAMFVLVNHVGQDGGRHVKSTDVQRFKILRYLNC